MSEPTTIWKEEEEYLKEIEPMEIGTKVFHIEVKYCKLTQSWYQPCFFLSFHSTPHFGDMGLFPPEKVYLHILLD